MGYIFFGIEYAKVGNHTNAFPALVILVSEPGEGIAEYPAIRELVATHISKDARGGFTDMNHMGQLAHAHGKNFGSTGRFAVGDYDNSTQELQLAFGLYME